MAGCQDTTRSNMCAAAGIGFHMLSPSPPGNAEVLPGDETPIRTTTSRPSRSSTHPAAASPLSLEHRFPPEARNSIQQSLCAGKGPHGIANVQSACPSLESVSDDQLRHCSPLPMPAPPYTPPNEPYHVFGKRKKWFVVITIGVAGLFSGLSSNIYFPSLDAIAQDLDISLQSVNLTTTSYLITQGLSPLLWGPLSDALGRRPVYIASFLVYIIANTALSFSPNFPVLLLFRGLQAAGSASTVSIGNGVIQDISPPSERGAFISFYQAIRNFSIAAGPVIGGLLAHYLGFRSIFIFLLILSTLVLATIIVFLPETMRKITGNGSIRSCGIYKPLIHRIRCEPSYTQKPIEPVVRQRVTAQTFVGPLKLLFQKHILLNLVFGGVVYAVWGMVTSSTTGLFKTSFNLNELRLGLVFVPNGLGTILGSTVVGNLMNKDFKTTEAQYRTTHNLPADFKMSSKSIPDDFPIERARLRHLPWISSIFVITTSIYGFSFAFPAVVSRKGWIAVPLILQFIIAATSNAVFAINQTLVSDLCPGQGASATAVNNLVRCGLSAVGVAVVELMILSLGPGATFLTMALLVVIVSPLAALNLLWGMRWRGESMKSNTKNESQKNGSFMDV